MPRPLWAETSKQIGAAAPETRRVLFSAETTRSCGDCQLCCKLLPIPEPELNKPAGKRCQHQKFKTGCTIYARRPFSCAHWSCRWLLSSDTADLRRPDRVHYVIDPMPDFVRVVSNETGKLVANVEVVQVWIDPDFPDAHRDPALRRFLLRRGEEGAAAIIRYSAMKAFTLMPPPMTEDKKWHEIHSGMREQTHTFSDYLAAQEENDALARCKDAP